MEECIKRKTDSLLKKQADGAIGLEDILQQWKRLSTENQEAFLNRISLVESGTVAVNAEEDQNINLKWKKQGPFDHLPPEASNTVIGVKSEKKSEQLEAVLEGIEFVVKKKLPRGLVLDKDKVQSPVTSRQLVDGCSKMATVLGKGNSAGEVTVFQDKKTGHEMALKTVMISQFNANEIRLWVHLGDEGLAPELYHFELQDNKLFFTMEIMTGKDMQDVIDQDMWSLQDPALARDFSLCVLHDLLDIWERMRTNHFVHGDMHAGNIRLETSMNVKLFDFGRAKNLLMEKTSSRLIKNDIVGIIRVFCALYSGFDFNDTFEALKILGAQDLKQLDESMIRISKENRIELYGIMTMLFDTVRKEIDSDSYGDTRTVSSYIRTLMLNDMDDTKRRAAVIIFPDLFQNKLEDDSVGDFCAECGTIDEIDAEDDFDPIWDDEDMDEFVNNVSDISLRQLGIY